MPVELKELLEELDFCKFEHRLSSKPAYMTTFGPHRVEVVAGLNRWLAESYFVSGIVDTGRSIALVEAELPTEVESKEQGLALLGYFLGRQIPERHKPPWLRIGERMTRHLPWACQNLPTR